MTLPASVHNTTIRNMSKEGHKKATKTPADHPPYSDMIKAAILALKERSGSSRQAIEKYIFANYKVADTGPHLKTALKKMTANGKLLQTKGVGASGSFKLAKEEKKPTAKKQTAAEKKSTVKPKKPTVKKAAAKKSEEKATEVKSAPKKAAKQTPAKKPATKKTTVNKSKSPKKAATKPAVKKTNKKAPVKKASSKK